MSRRSVMKHQFSEVPQARIPRSSFDRSHGLKTTFDSGYLIPIYVDEALPGDTFSMNMTGFARLATPIKPVMDNMFMETFFFAVPYRLLWDNWEKFNGEQQNPGDSISFLVPQVAGLATVLDSTIYDYMGIPIGVVGPLSANSLHFRAYNLIWNEWFRDQNLQNSVVENTDDGPDAPGDYALLRRGKRHDYFTSCLPWPQKGAAVTISPGSSAPVALADTGPSQTIGVMSDWFGEQRGLVPVTSTSVVLADPIPAGDAGLYADLSAAAGTTVNDLRLAFQTQKMLERDARGGTRYTEVIRSHFGVTSPDARLQRPEFLGGGSSRINITPVPQTQRSDTPSSTETPQGNLSGYGTATLNNHGFSKSFTEHCVIIGLANVRADLTYQQGLNRMWSRQSRLDFYWPALAHLGEQEVLNKEIYFSGDANDDLVFGYQERFAEYRYHPSRISGKFRSGATDSLDVWHLSQDFSALPVLNASFIEDNPPIDRVIAVQTEPQFLFDAYFNLRCARPMPLYGVPGFIDRF